MVNEHTLPDSRLAQRPDLETFMGEWTMPDGSFIRCEIQPIFCANCGKKYGYVPKDNTTFACYLCNKCFETWGAIAGTYAVLDDDFHQAVQHEMETRFGRTLTELEIFKLAEHGRLGTALEKLEKESPYQVMRT